MASQRLIIFGSQINLPNPEQLARLRTLLLENSHLEAFNAAIIDLDRTFQAAAHADPQLTIVPGQELLQVLRTWLISGTFTLDTTSYVPAIILTPLTVIIHIAEYFDLISQDPEALHKSLLESAHRPGVQGFCTGLLSAAAVASSPDVQSLVRKAATSLRLATFIGAYIDLDGFYNSNSKVYSCVVARSTSLPIHEAVNAVLAEHPGSYISVTLDADCVTITCKSKSTTVLLQSLAAQGLTARAIPLTGKFHSADNLQHAQKIAALCLSDFRLRLGTRDQLLVPVNVGEHSLSNFLHDSIVEQMLVHHCGWYKAIHENLDASVSESSLEVLDIGVNDSFPRSLQANPSITMTRLHQIGQHSTSSTAGKPEFQYGDDAIAVIGMSARFAGAKDLEQYWSLLQSGASMIGTLPAERFETRGLRRSTKYQPFLGNFVDDAYAFDHKFFGKSSREAEATDPQHKLILHVAYETLESAGYFSSGVAEKDVGVYVGVAASDYEDNVSSHPASAFSVMGMVRAFVSGKISHFFGFNGPSLVFDTACSSSAVAIHTACKAIQNGDCSSALAGGVNVITAPSLHQNLAGANFLSPTGASKAFDASADGYCRGEGAGLVLLKKLSAAVKDNDDIVGVIAGTAVNQNANTAPIVVPVSNSQTALYNKALDRAGLHASDVSYIEAHGTGTPKGDPIEAASIRQVFGDQKSRRLHFGSVKASIGHTEAASGVAGLIKVLLMMRHKQITPQASFKTLNPSIPPLDPANMEIARSYKPWVAPFYAACVNNYGAAGSNAVMAVVQPPKNDSLAVKGVASPWPIKISAKSLQSLQAYCKALIAYLNTQKGIASDSQLLASVSYHLGKRYNASFPFSTTCKAKSLHDLQTFLHDTVSQKIPAREPAKSQTSAVLVFSGQTGIMISLSKEVYDSSVVFKRHLDECAQILLGMGFPDIFPDIFHEGPVADLTKLHCMMFALQYSTAKAWIDCGLKVECLIGHSFGQLTAICVAGAISLKDGLRLVAGRALLIQQKWGQDKGNMMVIDAAASEVERLVQLASESSTPCQVEIACYNGQDTHVVVGTESDIAAFEQLVSREGTSAGPVKMKRLSVTHGFHSRFVDDIMADYGELLETLSYRKPSYVVETCSRDASWTHIGPSLLADQSREPVHFADAIRRVRQRLPKCAWVEAGSSSAAISLVRRALKHLPPSDDAFCSVKLGGQGAMESLLDTTMNMWNANCSVDYWPLHGSQRHAYTQLSLPPYQFEKHICFLPYVDKHEVPGAAISTPVHVPKERGLVYPADESSAAEGQSVLVVNQAAECYQASIKGHAVLGNPLCPVSLYVEIAMRAVALSSPSIASSDFASHIKNLEIAIPLGLDLSRNVQIRLSPAGGTQDSWAFQVFSTSADAPSRSITHATGVVGFAPADEKSIKARFSRFERLINYTRCEALLKDHAGNALQGSLVYKMFDKVVEYSDIYRGVSKICCKAGDVAGTVVLPEISAQRFKDTFLSNPHAVDNFTQVAGLHVNSLDECGIDEVYICSNIEEYQTLKDIQASRGPWLVFSNFTETAIKKELFNDIYVFDAETRNLIVTFHGLRFTKVKTAALQKALASANAGHAKSSIPQASRPGIPAPATVRALKEPQVKPPPAIIAKPTQSKRTALLKLLQEVADISPTDVQNGSRLEDIGIDSLMATEVVNAINKEMNLNISAGEFADIVDFEGLLAAVSEPQYSSNASSKQDSSIASESSSITSESSTSSVHSSDAEVPANSDAIEKLSALVSVHLDLPEGFDETIKLRDVGLDSLLGIELGNDIEKEFGHPIDMASLDPEITFGGLCRVVIPDVFESATHIRTKEAPSYPSAGVPPSLPLQAMPVEQPNMLTPLSEDFHEIRGDYERFAKQCGWHNFYNLVYPGQRQLVAAYIVEAFATLGCPLSSLKEGQALPSTKTLHKHAKVMRQYMKALEEESILYCKDEMYFRGAASLPSKPAAQLFTEALAAFPRFTCELRLLNATGSQLAACLNGTVEPLKILFGTKADRDLMTDVYTNSPMFKTGTRVLANFFQTALPKYRGQKIRILELGAGTGGTTAEILDVLSRLGVDYAYTFSDLSSSLVAAAKKRFSSYPGMEFTVVDIEKPAPPAMLDSYHIILSSNCIHATKSLSTSLANLRSLLRPDGSVYLLELTRNLYWLDCVFGLLEGWWLFDDGRTHVLASEDRWKDVMLQTGFKHVDWSDDGSREAAQFRIVAGFMDAPASLIELASVEQEQQVAPADLARMQTVEYAREDGVPLLADIYYPSVADTGKQRPVALMIHGGGHIMLSRRNIRPRQTRLLLDRGYLPISIDYRLCPETTLSAGPMYDACTALNWCRTTLPTLSLSRADIRPSQTVVAIGWSTGGTLAMSLGYTGAARSIAPPAAILAFYCPTDYMSAFWRAPNFPTGTSAADVASDYDLLEGVHAAPLTAYNVPTAQRAVGGWLSLRDPRSRIALHMNWCGQALPTLLDGLPPRDAAVRGTDYKARPIPSDARVAAVCALSQIRAGAYNTPTFLVHGTQDDLVPWEHSVRVRETLADRGVQADIEVVDGGVHLFDLYRDPDGKHWDSVLRGYNFLDGFV